MNRLTHLHHVGALYSLTITWIAGAALAIAVTQGWVTLGPGVSVLAIVGLVLLQSSCRRELADVHHLVNAQHDELVARVEQLIRALEGADVPVPKKPIMQT